MEEIIISVKDPELTANWYEDIFGFKLFYIEEEAAVMKITEQYQTIVCLVKNLKHQPMRFPSNNFGVGKYNNFIPQNREETYKSLFENNLKFYPVYN
ncbi:VOC family protein [Psychrobacillus sp. INOP01]|uniref:VOC family protein n=1 Tax=Psychrobacillus sp. INOP01 TaxID=2829187 RepID=UPI001BA946DF|nr:VOC family protein [Psychrobacillus sp. INOP01]QUG41349.1 VOC family protein [Psychrobacillus sp. INOP01]